MERKLGRMTENDSPDMYTLEIDGMSEDRESVKFDGSLIRRLGESKASTVFDEVDAYVMIAAGLTSKDTRVLGSVSIRTKGPGPTTLVKRPFKMLGKQLKELHEKRPGQTRCFVAVNEDSDNWYFLVIDTIRKTMIVYNPNMKGIAEVQKAIKVGIT